MRKAAIAATALFLAACTHTFTPQPKPIPDGDVDFQVVGTVAVENAQPSTERFLVRKQGAHKWYTDLHTWTDAAVNIAEQAVVKRGAGGEPQKLIKLAVVGGGDLNYFWAMHEDSSVTLKAETGDGYVNTYKSDLRKFNGFGGCPDCRENTATMMAVEAMFQDPKIQAYLASGKKAARR